MNALNIAEIPRAYHDFQLLKLAKLEVAAALVFC